MPDSVTISGTRSTSHHADGWFTALFERFVRPFVGADVHVYVGGAPGIDTLVLRWLAELARVRITVVVPARLADQPVEARDAVAGALYGTSVLPTWSSCGTRASPSRRPTRP